MWIVVASAAVFVSLLATYFLMSCFLIQPDDFFDPPAPPQTSKTAPPNQRHPANRVADGD